MSRPPFPSPEDARNLHALLLAGHPGAAGLACEAFLAPLIAHLRLRFPQADDHLLEDAAHLTLVNHVKRPEKYDPARHPDPGAYLRMDAEGDVRNAVRREGKHHRDREFVELDAVSGKEEGGGPLLRLIRDEDAADFRRAVEAASDPTDLVVMRLLMAGEKATAVFAAALGIGHLPPPEQEAEVKRAKDRAHKRWRRRLKPYG